MAAAFEGIRILRVVSMADMRLGREGQIGTAVLFLVDGDGPFGFEVDRPLEQFCQLARADLPGMYQLGEPKAVVVGIFSEMHELFSYVATFKKPGQWRP